MSARRLTKSRFKTGMECPTKLYFLDDPTFGNAKDDDSFLRSLAEGGFQVGELAKIYYPDGIEVTSKKHEDALAETAELLKHENVVIFEAAFAYEALFVRVDILVKSNHKIELIEVKSSSYSPVDDGDFLGQGGGVLSAWKPYLIDVAFQNYVINRSHPHYKVEPYLMLADKTRIATVDGLNQMFVLVNNGERSFATVREGTSLMTVGKQILIKVEAKAAVQSIWNADFGGANFDQKVAELASATVLREWKKPNVSARCKGCEFRIDDQQKSTGLKSGFEKCWSEAKGLKQKDFSRDFVFEIGGIRSADKMINAGTLFIDQLTDADTLSDRQWLQVNLRNTTKTFIDRAALKHEMDSWTYPLNFIDFETMRTAIPFYNGRRPYEQSAFQFSHHTVDRDGRVTHANQFINVQRGAFPNFDFARALKKALEQNQGTIFRYSAHENTVLREIYLQLEDSQEFDRKPLMAFIDSITERKIDRKTRISGDRNMVDLLELVKEHYYHPLMAGSNSIKYVLPAIIQDSTFLQDRYSRAVYGTPEMPSHNFKDWHWLEKTASGAYSDPYRRLGDLFRQSAQNHAGAMYRKQELADGGAALTAYARMQFTEMSDAEFAHLQAALLRYCELDTLAMVMIFEYWREECRTAESAQKRA